MQTDEPSRFRGRRTLSVETGQSQQFRRLVVL